MPIFFQKILHFPFILCPPAKSAKLKNWHNFSEVGLRIIPLNKKTAREKYLCRIT